MNEERIKNRLVRNGQQLFRRRTAPEPFALDPNADKLVKDLERHPHAFVLACVMDRQITAERAWAIPYAVSDRLGTFSMRALSKLSLRQVEQLMRNPHPLHRFPDRMSACFHSAIRRIAHQYKGDASRIWAHRPSSAAVVYRFLEFDGAGPKIATMAANILARDFKIPFSDFYSIDVSVDRHIRRVFTRLGLCQAGATIEQIVYKARELSPTFPGLMDLPAWQIGKSWCLSSRPACSQCYMRDLCPSAS